MIVKYPVSYLKWEICQQHFKKTYISSDFLHIDLMVKYYGINFWQLDQNRLFLVFSISESKHHKQAFKIILLFIVLLSKDAEFSLESCHRGIPAARVWSAEHVGTNGRAPLPPAPGQHPLRNSAVFHIH